MPAVDSLCPLRESLPGALGRPVAVLGGGITGLTAAWTLRQAGVNVAVFEAGPRVGGAINTFTSDGWMHELGPNSMLEAWSLGVPVVSLSVDPGGIIERQGIGFLSGSDLELCNDVRLLTHRASLNDQIGVRALAYVRGRHSLEAVCAAIQFPGHPALLMASQGESAR